MLKSFIRTGRPDEGNHTINSAQNATHSYSDWKPMGSTGLGYFVLDYRVEHGRIVEKPHFVDAYFYPDALKFWLHDLGQVERRARTDQASDEVGVYLLPNQTPFVRYI